MRKPTHGTLHVRSWVCSVVARRAIDLKVLGPSPARSSSQMAGCSQECVILHRFIPRRTPTHPCIPSPKTCVTDHCFLTLYDHIGSLKTYITLFLHYRVRWSPVVWLCMYCCYTWTLAAFYPREGAQKIAHKNCFDGVRTNPNNIFFFVYFQHMNARIVRIILFGASNAKGEFLKF